MLRNYKYLLSLTTGIVVITGNMLGGWWVAANFIFTLGVLAGLEGFVPENKNNNTDGDKTNPNWYFDIIIKTPSGKEVSVTDGNSFNYSNRALRIHNMNSATKLLIDGNTFSNFVSTADPYNGTAISIDNGTLALYPYWGGGNSTVINNTITDMRIGVHALDVKRIQVGNTLKGNTVSFSTYTNNSYGIWAENSKRAKLDENTVTYNGSATYNGEIILGMSIEACQLALARRCSLYTKNGYDIQIQDDCGGTQMRCNYIADGNFGVQFTNGVLSHQGISGEPWDNEWHNIATDRIEATGVPPQVNWWYQGAVSPSNVYKPIPSLSLGNLISQHNTSQTNSDVCIEGDNTSPRNEINDSLVYGVNIYSTNSSSYTWWAKFNLFQELLTDTNLLTEHISTDSAYHAFYNNMRGSNIEKFLVIEGLIDSNKLAAAKLINDSLVPANKIDSNLKAVYKILIGKVLVDSLLSHSDSTTLESIAKRVALTDGPAVYMARSILFLEVHYPDVPRFLSYAPPSKEELTVYPNPAMNFCTVNHPVFNNEKWIEIYNSLGKRIERLNIKSGTIATEINLHKYCQGIYFLNVSGESKLHSHLVIVKQ